MSEDKAPTNEELINMIKGLKGESKSSASSGWEKKQAASGDTDVQSISIPISVQTDGGKLRVYLHFSGSNASSPEALMALIDDLDSKGLPLDIWKQKQQYNKKKSW